MAHLTRPKDDEDFAVNKMFGMKPATIIMDEVAQEPSDDIMKFITKNVIDWQLKEVAERIGYKFDDIKDQREIDAQARIPMSRLRPRWDKETSKKEVEFHGKVMEAKHKWLCEQFKNYIHPSYHLLDKEGKWTFCSEDECYEIDVINLEGSMKIRGFAIVAPKDPMAMFEVNGTWYTPMEGKKSLEMAMGQGEKSLESMTYISDGSMTPMTFSPMPPLDVFGTSVKASQQKLARLMDKAIFGMRK
jgi:hypothetical protein